MRRSRFILPDFRVDLSALPRRADMFGRRDAAAPATAHAGATPTQESSERFPGVGGLLKLVGTLRMAHEHPLTGAQASTCSRWLRSAPSPSASVRVAVPTELMRSDEAHPAPTRSFPVLFACVDECGGESLSSAATARSSILNSRTRCARTCVASR